MPMHRIVVAVTGASGSIYTKLLLEKLQLYDDQWEEVSLVMTDNAKTVWETELENTSYTELPFPQFDKRDFSAPFASGSARYDVMIVCPCSMGMLGRIAHGISDDLISRAADVILKERRKLICVLRDTPYNLIHIQNMKLVTEAGGVICPATPSFYSKPRTMEELASTVVDRVLELSGIELQTFRWGEEKGEQ
ncbi:MAG: UbiX family flavin prenyltransferase [Chitinophagaceae bacterium]|nr:MAG: UbiX family flavin prenyltransferase [Chitinophagaceae bacterium]